jgi:hypothetical protein
MSTINKMKLVPLDENVEDFVRSTPQQQFYERKNITSPAWLNVASDLDKQINKILQSNLNDYNKAKLYIKTLEKFLTIMSKYQPKTVQPKLSTIFEKSLSSTGSYPNIAQDVDFSIHYDDDDNNDNAENTDFDSSSSIIRPKNLQKRKQMIHSSSSDFSDWSNIDSDAGAVLPLLESQPSTSRQYTSMKRKSRPSQKAIRKTVKKFIKK